MSSESIHGEDNSPQRNRKRVSRRKKQKERQIQCQLNRDLDKLNLTSSQNAEEVDGPQRKPKGLSHKKYEKVRRNRRRLNNKLSKLNLGHAIDADEPEATGDGQIIGQTTHQKPKYNQFGSFVGAVENGNGNELVHGIGAPTNSDLAKLGFEELKSFSTPDAKKARLFDVQMNEAPEGYPTIQRGTLIKLTSEPDFTMNPSAHSAVIGKANNGGF